MRNGFFKTKNRSRLFHIRTPIRNNAEETNLRDAFLEMSVWKIGAAFFRLL